MTLPPRLAKKPKRDGRWRSPGHLNFVRKHHCSVPGCLDLPIHAHHVKRGSDGGMGRKPSDYHCISLCAVHHDEIHRGEESFEAKHNIDVRVLADVFAKTSPKAREIREARNATPHH